MSNSVRHKQKRADRAKQMQKENRMIRAGMNSGRNLKYYRRLQEKRSWWSRLIDRVKRIFTRKSFESDKKAGDQKLSNVKQVIPKSQEFKRMNRGIGIKK